MCRWVDKISDARQEFSYSAQRLVAMSFLTLLALHYFGCIIWFTVRVQEFPEGEGTLLVTPEACCQAGPRAYAA